MAISIGACAVETRTAVVVPSDACTSYGFTRASADYLRCQELMARQRAAGRVSGLTDARVTAAAQDACAAYGVLPGSAQYDKCVQDEFAARRPG